MIIKKLLAAVLVLGGCQKAMIVEAKDVKFYEIDRIENATGSAVRIRGLVFHSSLAVKRITITPADDTVNVEVLLTPAGKGLSGSFTTEVPLSDGIKRITFGASKVQVWPKQ